MTKGKRSGVDDYIARWPKEARGDLAKIRAAIRAAAPGSIERTDHFQMPGYSNPRINDYDGMFAWFSFKKPHIRLNVPPSVIQEFRKEVEGYGTTKARHKAPEKQILRTSWSDALEDDSVEGGCKGRTAVKQILRASWSDALEDDSLEGGCKGRTADRLMAAPTKD